MGSVNKYQAPMPLVGQLLKKIAGLSPINPDIHPLVVLGEVVASGLGILLSTQLDRHVESARSAPPLGHKCPMDDAKAPVGEAVADEEQRPARERFLDLGWQQFRIADVDQEVEVIVLGKDH